MYNSYVAIGDSFTEGMGDDDASYPNGVRGWADRVAQVMGANNADFRYANLAIRGRKVDQIIDEQLGPAIALDPDIISVQASGNDLMRPVCDMNRVIDRLQVMFSTLRSKSNAKILTFTACDLPKGPYSTMLRGRFALINECVRDMVDSHKLILVDMWKLNYIYQYSACWCEDKIHMSTYGHSILANRVLGTLGYTPNPDPVLPDFSLREFDREFMTKTVAPWIARKIRGVSSGDGLEPKYAQYIRLS